MTKKKHDLKFAAQSLVEFAIILPILLVLIISGIELGRVFFTQIVITNAAREGAYYLTTHALDGSAVANTQLAAETEASDSGISNITVDISPPSGWNPGDNVTITVETTVNDLLILGLMGNFLSISSTRYDQFPLSSSVDMMVQP
jgi:Flp pilus assembly protein TadG